MKQLIRAQNNRRFGLAVILGGSLKRAGWVAATGWFCMTGMPPHAWANAEAVPAVETVALANPVKRIPEDPCLESLQTALDHYSTAKRVDTGHVRIDLGSGWINKAGSVYSLDNDSPISGIKSWTASPCFVNEGLFRKTGGAATSRVEIAFHNQGGTIEVDTGTLALVGTGSSGSLCSNGTFQVAKGAVLDLGGGNVNVFNGSYTGDGEGVVQFNRGIIRTGTDFEPTIFRFLEGGFQWNGGMISPALNEFINEGRFQLDGSSVKNVGHGPGFRNKGTVVHKGTGQLNIEYGGSWRNDAGALYDLQGDMGLSAVGGEGARPSFNNEGTFRKSRGSGVANVGSDFRNAGTVEVASGTLNFTESFTQFGGVIRLAGGELASATPVDIRAGDLVGTGRVLAEVQNSGRVAPGCSPGTLDVLGGYSQSEQGLLDCELGGRTPGHEYDQLIVHGKASLAGRLKVTLVRGFNPLPGDQFQIVQCGNCQGMFSATEFPPLPDGLAWQVGYDLKGVSLTVVTR